MIALFQVLGICFSPNGYHLATAGEDNTCRIWDLRRKRCIYIIPAHASLISQVKYEPQEGYFLATASYDTKAMVWSAKNFKPVKTLFGHEGRVTDLDITGGNSSPYILSHILFTIFVMFTHIFYLFFRWPGNSHRGA